MYCRYAHSRDNLYYGCYRQSHGLCERGVYVRAAWLIPELERQLLARVGEARTSAAGLRIVDPVEPLVGEVQRTEASLGHLTLSSWKESFSKESTERRASFN